MFAFLKASLKLILFILFAFVFLVPVILFRWHQGIHQSCMRLFFKCSLWLWGIRVDDESIKSRLANNQLNKSLFISNHCSYIDIFILGAYLPVKFTPKSDIASWPVIGWIVKLSGAVFLDRRPSQAKKQQAMLEESYAQGNQLLLFAEGTTGNGAELLPFKSSLFSVAHLVEGIEVVPVLLKYKKLNSKRAGRTELDQLAWYADMTLAPHFWNLLKQSSVNVSIEMFDAIAPSDYPDRKLLASACESVLRKNF